MPYSTKADAYLRLPAFKEDAGIWDAKIDAAITDADAVIDAKLGKVIRTPFSAPIPGKISMLSRMLTRACFLLDQYTANGKKGEPILANVLWNRAMKLMDEMIESPSSILEPEDGLPIPGMNLAIKSSTSGRKPVLRDWDLMSNFIPTLHQQLAGIPEAFVISPRSMDQNTIFFGGEYRFYYPVQD